MPPDFAVAASTRPDPLYSALQERVMARDQKGASEVYYSLVRDGRPLPEMLREAVRIHAPYTHVPYHERIDDGYVNFVNNDHCLLSARASAASVEDGAGRRVGPADGADHLVHADRPRHLEPEDRQGAGPLCARLPDARRTAAGAGRALARPGAAGARRPAEGAARPLDDPGASRPGGRRLPRVPRPDAEPGRAARGAGRTRASPA